jgi:hypothetical protein
MNRATQVLLNEQHHIVQSVLLRRVRSSMIMDSSNWVKRVGVWELLSVELVSKSYNQVSREVSHQLKPRIGRGRFNLGRLI